MTKLVSGKNHLRQVYLISETLGRNLLNYQKLAQIAKIDFPGLIDEQITCGTANMEHDNENYVFNGFPCIMFVAPQHEVPKEYQNFQFFSVV